MNGLAVSSRRSFGSRGKMWTPVRNGPPEAGLCRAAREQGWICVFCRGTTRGWNAKGRKSVEVLEDEAEVKGW